MSALIGWTARVKMSGSLKRRLERLEKQMGADDEIVEFFGWKGTSGEFRQMLDEIDCNTTGLPRTDEIPYETASATCSNAITSA